MRKLFFTGLITLLPFTLTFLIIIFIINLFTNPFQSIFENILEYYGVLNSHFLIYFDSHSLYLLSKILIIMILFAFTILIGFVGRLFLIKSFFRLGDYFIQHIPFVNKVYKSTQDLVKTLFKSTKSSFSQAVLVPFPHNKAYSMGFLTEKQDLDSKQTHLLVFIPGTPNPTTGFLLSYKYEEIIFLDMKVEDAIKFIISCGITLSKL